MPRDLFEILPNQPQKQPRDLLAEPAPAPVSRNPLRWLGGAAETALGIGTGMVSTPINEFIAAGADFFPGGETGEQYLQNPAIGTYQPRLAEGQAISRGLQYVTAPIGKAIDWVADPGGEHPVGEHAIKGLLGVLPAAPLLRRGQRTQAPSIDDLRRQSRAAYQAAESGTGVVAQNSLAGFTGRAERMLADEGVDATLHPSTMAALTRLYDESTRPNISGHTLQGLEINRRVIAAAENAAKAGSDDARLAGRLLDDFDDYIDNLSPSDLVGGYGTAAETAQAYAQARNLWTRMRRAETIEGLVERARNSAPSLTQSGMENALRLEFKSLANNPRRFNRFTPEERAAILQVVRGTTTQNTLRYAGKLAVRGPISGGVTIGGGMAAGGPVLAGVLAGSGEGGRLAANLMRRYDVDRVREMVRQGPVERIAQQRSPAQQLSYLPAFSLTQEPLDRRQMVIEALRN